MKISRLIIKNYRNLKDIDICLGETVVLVGENNSGKSNLLRAVTLPFLTDESSFLGKSLSWIRDKEKFVYSLMKQEFDNACVRDINEDLFINNTEYHEDMSHESWRPLSDLL